MNTLNNKVSGDLSSGVNKMATGVVGDSSTIITGVVGDSSKMAPDVVIDRKIAFLPNNYFNFFIDGIKNPIQLNIKELEKYLLIFKVLITDNKTLKEFESVLKLLTPFIYIFITQLNKSLIANEDKITKLINDIVNRIAVTSLDAIKAVPLYGNAIGIVSALFGVFDSIKKSIELGSFTVSNGVFTPIESVLKEVNETISNYDKLDEESRDTINKILGLMKRIENMSKLPIEEIEKMGNNVSEQQNTMPNIGNTMPNIGNTMPKVIGGNKYRKTMNKKKSTKLKKYRKTIKKCIQLFKQPILIY